MDRLGYMMAYHTEFAAIRAVGGFDRPCDCETCLKKRVQKLFDANYREWAGADAPAGATASALDKPTVEPGWDYKDAIRWQFGHSNIWIKYRRGFVEHITASAADFLAHADAIRRQTPLRKVTLTTLPQTQREPSILAENYEPAKRRHVGRERWWWEHEIVFRRERESWDEALLRMEFPGIEFELPPADGVPPGGMTLTDFASDAWPNGVSHTTINFLLNPNAEPTLQDYADTDFTPLDLHHL